MKLLSSSLLGALAVAALSSPASAHVTVSSGPAVANASNVITFQIAHGCPGTLATDPQVDTYSLKINIPAGVTSVRAMTSTIGTGPTVITRDAGGAVTSVTFSKAALTEAHADDDSFYLASLRLKTPNAPFAQIYFTAEQTCKKPDGTTFVVQWNALPGGTGEPAAALVLVPARVPGWNKYTIGESTHIADADFATLFKDAVIVWKGTAAYSVNPNVTTQITSTTGVTALTGGIHPGDDIWVRY